MHLDTSPEREDPRPSGTAGARAHLRVAMHASPRDRDEAGRMRTVARENLPHARWTLAVALVALAFGPLMDSTAWWVVFTGSAVTAAWMIPAYLRAIRR